MMYADCIFCQIIRKERPAEFIYEDDALVVFKDAYPHAPVHLLIVPKKHIRGINDLADEDREIISEMILRAKEIALGAGVSQSGYKLVFNVERGAGQVIFHLHLHLTAGWHHHTD
jgi:histidine triad (HIT) family protein